MAAALLPAGMANPGGRIETMPMSDYLTGLSGQADPIIRSNWDVYLVGNALIYAREQCGQSDVAPRFFLHLIPDGGRRDLPDHRRRYGFDNLDFDFAAYGARGGGKCVAVRPLPAYGVREIRTGQYIPGEGRVWEGVSMVAGPDGEEGAP